MAKDKIGSIEELTNDVIENDIDVVKYEERLVAKSKKSLKQLKQEMIKDTASDFPSTQKNVVKKRVAGAKLAKKVGYNIRKTYDAIDRSTAAELGHLAAIESEFMRGAVNNFAGGTIASNKIKSASSRQLVRDIAIQGAPSANWWSRQGVALQQKFTDKVLQAVQNNWSLDQMVDAIRGTEARLFKDGIMSVSEVQADALARTSVQTVTNAARMATLSANSDVMESIQWLATLDGRTSMTCIGLNGKQWKLPEYTPIHHGLPFPGPTAHWRCRSTQIPITKAFKDLPKGKQKLVSNKAKANMGDKLDDGVSFNKYLANLPDYKLALLLPDPKQLRRFKAGKLSEADVLAIASKQPIDATILKQNLARMGISSFDDIDTEVFVGKSIADAEKLIVNAPNEIALIAKNGKIEKVIVGDTASVEFDWFTRKDLFDSTITHNHGAASSFSTADIELFLKHKPNQFRVVMPVNDIQAGFLGANSPVKQATIIMEKIDGGPDISVPELMRRIKDEREIYFKSVLDASDDVVVSETQARFASYVGLKRVADDVPGISVRTEFSHGKIGVSESIDDIITKLNKDRNISVVEPETILLTKANKLGLKVDDDLLAETRVRGILKEMHPDKDSALFNLEDEKVWASVNKFAKKNPEVLELPLSQFEQGATFNSLKYSYASDIRDSGGPSNTAWLSESVKQLFIKADVPLGEPARVLNLKERLAIQKVLENNSINDAFEFKKVNEIAKQATEAAKVRNEIALGRANTRIELRQDGAIAKSLNKLSDDLRKDSNALRTANERLDRVIVAKDTNKILHAKADIAELELNAGFLGAGFKTPKIKPKFKPVPRFQNEKHINANELPDLEDSVRSSMGKTKPQREAALTAKDKARSNYDKAYQDFIHMDVDDFNELLDKSIGGDLLSEHEALVISRGIAAGSSKFTMLKDNFKPKSFEDLIAKKRELFTNYQAYVTIDARLKNLRGSNIFKKNIVDPVVGVSNTSIAEENVLAKTVAKWTANKTKKGYIVGGKTISVSRMNQLLDLAEEGKYIIGKNRAEPFMQSLIQFATDDYDWSKVKHFRAQLNGTKAVPGVLFNKTFQYTEKLRKEWDASKNVSIQSSISLSRKSEAGVNTIAKIQLVQNNEAITSTKISKRKAKLVRYPNMSGDELLVNELVNEQRLAADNIKSWSVRIKRPQQTELVRKSADGDIVVLEPMDLRKKVFKDLSLAISDQRSTVKISEVNSRIGEIVLDARIYKSLKTNLAGKLDMSEYEPDWSIARESGTTKFSLFEYGLRDKLNKLGKLHQKDIDSIYAKGNAKVDEAYRITLKSPKRALSLNAIDDQKAVAAVVSEQSENNTLREKLLLRGKRAASESTAKVAGEVIEASSYGKELSKVLLEDAYQIGASFDPTSQRMAQWIKASKHPTDELSDRIIMSIIDSDLSQGAMGPMAGQIGSMMAKSAGITGVSHEVYMQVGAKVLQYAEKQKLLKRSKRPLLDKDKEPVLDNQGNFKEAWFVEIANDKLKAVALSEPSLRRFSKLPQGIPSKFNPEALWEYEDGTSIVKTFDKDLLQRVYANTDTPFRRAIEAKNNTAFTVDSATVKFFDKLRATGLKNADGGAIIPAWDLAIDPKSKQGVVNRSKTVQWNNIHAAAKAIQGEDELYFKYTADFRGRSYASGVVHPQGPPQAKSYFRFKNVDPIGNEANANHFWLDMSTRAGHDKLPKTKADYEDWQLVETKYGKDAAKRKLTGQEYGFEVVTPEFAKIADDLDTGKFWSDPKARAWIDHHEDEWPEVFAAANEVKNLRKHVEARTGKKLFSLNEDGSYKVAMTKIEVEKAMLDYKPTLIPHIDGTTNAYQQMSMMTRDDDLGRIANIQRGQKLYDAYYYTGLTIKQTDEAVVAAAIKRDNPILFNKAIGKLGKRLDGVSPDEKLELVGVYLKSKNFSEYDQSRRVVKKALDIKKAAVEAMPEVFGKDATVSITDLRQLFKYPVMLQPYGASMTTILNTIKKEGHKLAKKNPEKLGFLAKGDNAKLIGQAVVEMNPIFYPKAQEYQAFLRELTSRHNAGVYNSLTGKYVTGDDGRPVAIPLSYKLPNGVELTIDYKTTLDVPVEVSFGKETGWLTTQIRTDKVKSSKQISSVSANMTHSHDAAWDHLWTDILASKGVKNFVGIHDAAGTDFGHMDQLHDAWRQAGVTLYQDYDLFKELLEQSAERGVNIQGLKPPKMGTLDVRELLDSEYAIH